MSMPSFGEPHGMPLGKSEKGSPHGRFSHIDDEKFFSKGATNGTVSASWYDAAKIQRPHVGGKFLFVGRDKLWIRGVTYGAFRPGPNGQEYHETKVLERVTWTGSSHRNLPMKNHLSYAQHWCQSIPITAFVIIFIDFTWVCSPQVEWPVTSKCRIVPTRF